MELTTHTFSPRQISAKGFKLGLVTTTQWNDEITVNLYRYAYKALSCLVASGQNIHSWKVPGCFGLIYVAYNPCHRNSIDCHYGFIGTMIKGEIKHFEYVCEAVSQDINQYQI
ncbi:MAG: 6,7-dimethyl-8-ribityllumazine synthase [Flavobacteriales bacterium]